MKLCVQQKWLVWSLGAVLLLTGSVSAGDPPSILSMFRKKKPLANESLELKVEHGPWMILATTLAGENAQQQATALATEIRSTMRLPCYIMEKTVGSNQTLATRSEKTDKYGNQKRYQLELKYANSSPKVAYAVLVGEFSSTDDPRIQDTLNYIRKAQPQALTEQGQVQPASADDSNWLVQKYRSVIWAKTDRNQANGPMGAAFVTRNPLLPDDYFQAPRVDKFVESLNREPGVKFSLLDCPGRFTVRVASFRGQEATDFGSGRQAAKLDEKPDLLGEAGDKANTLAVALRKKGVEAYEFHDRFGSFVTIGSFDKLGDEVGPGQFQYNPAMIAILQKYCGYQVLQFNDPITGAISKRTSLKSEAKIPFDIEGKPMAVPRLETSRLYSNSLLGGR
ncbi:MAG: hypothetical protein R3C53_18515 [Pirellulaceae bacterium]